MVASQQPLERFPRWTLGLAAGALLAQVLPGVAALLVYDRAGIAGGELWRLWTGHLVHFSLTHLVYNLAVLVPATWIVETRHRGDVGALLLFAAPAISVALFLVEPGIREFGGASGLSLALVTYLALRGMHGALPLRLVYGSVLGIVCWKLAAESLGGWSLRDWQVESGFTPLPLSHLVGAATGAALGAWRFRYRLVRRGWTVLLPARGLGRRLAHLLTRRTRHRIGA